MVIFVTCLPHTTLVPPRVSCYPRWLPFPCHLVTPPWPLQRVTAPTTFPMPYTLHPHFTTTLPYHLTSYLAHLVTVCVVAIPRSLLLPCAFAFNIPTYAPTMVYLLPFSHTHPEHLPLLHCVTTAHLPHLVWLLHCPFIPHTPYICFTLLLQCGLLLPHTHTPPPPLWHLVVRVGFFRTPAPFHVPRCCQRAWTVGSPPPRLDVSDTFARYPPPRCPTPTPRVSPQRQHARTTTGQTLVGASMCFILVPLTVD